MMEEAAGCECDPVWGVQTQFTVEWSQNSKLSVATRALNTEYRALECVTVAVQSNWSHNNSLYIVSTVRNLCNQAEELGEEKAKSGGAE
jgi:hypothetical protein